MHKKIGLKEFVPLGLLLPRMKKRIVIVLIVGFNFPLNFGQLVFHKIWQTE